MASITFDTLKFTKRLREAGYTEQQAEAAAEAQKDVLNEVLDTTLATRADVKELEIVMRKDIAEFKAEIIKWVAAMLVGQTAVLAALVKLLK